MNKSKVCLIATMVFVAAGIAIPLPADQVIGGASGTTAPGSPSAAGKGGSGASASPSPASQRAADDTADLLTSGPWKITGTNWSTIRVFNKDGTFSSKPNPNEWGKWQISGKVITLTFRDGHQDTISLPLKADGTAGTDSHGNVTSAVLEKNSAAIAANAEPKIDIDLPANSTIGDVIALLKKNFPQYGYIISSEKLKEVKIGEIKLRDANIVQLADALNTASNRGIVARTDYKNTLYLSEPGSGTNPPTNTVATFARPKKIDLDLPVNSTVGDAIALLNKNYPDFGVNISSEKLKDVKIGKLKFRGASIMELAMTLSFAGSGQFSATGGNNTLFLREIKAQPTPTPVVRPKIDVDLPPESTIGDFVSLLKKNYPQYTYKLSSPALNDVRIGEMKLHDAEPEVVCGSLFFIFRNKVTVKYENSTNTFSFTQPDRKAVSTFNIGAWLGDLPEGDIPKKVKQLDDMIKTTILMVNSVNDGEKFPVPVSSYYSAGKIYVLTGDSQAVMIANKIVQALVPKAVPAPGVLVP